MNESLTTRGGGRARRPIAVCVLGTARAGTSLTTRILNFLGVHLGPSEGLVGAKPGNPTGYWENRHIMHLNNRVLEAHGGSGASPPILAPGWETSDELAAERDAARGLIEAVSGGHGTWGWKDPKNSLTLPFWRQIVPEMRYVICVRNPVDTAASVKRRREMPLDQTLQLWSRYMSSAIVNTAGLPRLFVHYEDYFDDWRPVAARLARLIGRGPRLDRDKECEIDHLVDRQLWHHRTAPAEIVADDRVPSEVSCLYLIARLLGDAPHDRDDERTAATQAIADLYAGQLLGVSPVSGGRRRSG